MSASWQTGRNATGARSPDPPDDESSSLFAAAHSTDMITMTMGELETLKRTMKARLDDVQKRVDRAMQRTEALQTENKRLASLVQELTEAKLTSEATDTFAALRALPATRGANGETVDAEAERRRAELRRELLRGLELIAGNDEHEAHLDGAGEGPAPSGMFASVIEQWNSLVYRVDPFRRDLSYVSSRYGEGVLAVFGFLKSTCMASFFYTIIWGVNLIRLRLNSSTPFTQLTGVLPTWTLFSGFPSSSSGDILYVSALVACAALAAISAIRKTIADNADVIRAKVLESSNNPKHFSSRTLNLWDFTIKDPQAASDRRNAVAGQLQILLSEHVLQQKIRGRTPMDLALLWARRTFGLLLNLTALAASWTVIIVLTIDKTVADRFPHEVQGLVAPIATSVIGSLLPMLTFLITDFERWDNPSTVVKHQMWRLYAGRQLNILINVLSYFTIAKGQALLPQLGSLSVSHDGYTCGVDAAGAGLFYLVLSEFFVSKIILAGIYIVKKVAKRFVSLELSEYSVSQNIIDLLYFQSLVWISLPLYPAGSILCVLLLFTNFKWERLKLTVFMSRPLSSWSDKNTTTFFNNFYNVTLATCLLTYMYFLNSSWSCAGNLGPFAGAPGNVPVNVFEAYAEQFGLSILYSIVTNVAPYLAAAVVLYALWRFRSNHQRTLERLLERTETLHLKETTALRAELDTKQKIIAAQRKAATIS
ncbi:unnamed protein product (mitochondrion) [Plasmodiophora brassicae]|uniref:TMC domain-containing protein n=1 Tax=Plasmodiophora brassicae TaxID=37360 RepID=A0A0G4IV58_PLABS|nr:hypothetical protein PBRA_001060 [Plasmodiophora brassicae]SPQ97169.1 unnamed protein product [Plasmodiophora brassicae]